MRKPELAAAPARLLRPRRRRGMIGEASFYGPANIPEAPTAAPPGSEEKIRIMTERAARREQLFHPHDGPFAAAASQSSPSALEKWAHELDGAQPAILEPLNLFDIELEDDADFDSDDGDGDRLTSTHSPTEPASIP
jgi:hypothetical protein